jgi:hypothetical protein
MSQVPGLGHVTFYRHPGRYPTLFHSPLGGVDKETLATSTLRFPREVRRRNELPNVEARLMMSEASLADVRRRRLQMSEASLGSCSL